MSVQLTEIQADALSELLNLGVGLAAAGLSDMANQEVRIAVPSLRLVDIADVRGLVAAEVSDDVALIEQRIDGAFGGVAMLLFPSHRSLDLVQAMLQDGLAGLCPSEFEQEALTELGNVMLNACVGHIANEMGLEVRTDIPELRYAPTGEVFPAAPGASRTVLLVQIRFALAEADVPGNVCFLLDLGAVSALGQNLDRYIQRVTQAWASA